MSDKKAHEEEKPEGDAAEGAAEAPAKKGKKKLIFIAAGVLVIAIAGGLFASGMLGGSAPKKSGDVAEEGHGGGHGKEGEHGEGEAALDNSPVYFELPQFLVNLNAPSGKVSFLKMSVTLELRDKEAVKLMTANKPRIMDVFNTYLRELRPADIQGSAGIYHLRNELLTRLNSTIEDGVVKDILFGEIIVQ